MRLNRLPPLLALLGAFFAHAQDSRPAADAPDERISVRLKNGESLIGVALRGVKSEKLSNGRFEATTDVTGPKTGVRVWYYRDLDGYMFLEHRNIAEMSVLDVLTKEQSQDLTDALGAARRGREEARRAVAAAKKAAESRPAPVDDETDPEAKPVVKKTDAPPPLTEAERALLDAFPPEEGWSPESYGELKRRAIVLHVYPNKNEQAFIDSFADWRAAWTRRSEIEAAKPAPLK